MKNILDDKNILIVNVELAKIVGLDEAIFIQQIYYWCNINEKKKINYEDGFYWTFNTIEKWHEQFPFWSISKIRRIIDKLEVDGFIISSNYNKKGFDRTKWYRINEEKFAKMNIPLVQNELMDCAKMS